MPVFSKIFSRSATVISIAFALITLLTACGSQESSNTNITTDNAASKTANVIASASPSAQTDSGLLKSLAVLYPNGQLPADRAAQTAKERKQNPAALLLTAGASSRIAAQSTTKSSVQSAANANPQAVAADYKPVNRLQMPPDTLYGAYFFTIYDFERDAALASNADWKQEGPAFWTSLATGEGLNPVHRYRNLFNGSYIYTIYDSERADIAANYASTFTYEGVAWHARQTQSDGWSPLYRFRNLTNNTYLFSAYESEKDAIVAGFSAVFTLEGIAYYVRQDAPDTTAPVITVLGDNPQSLTTGTAYVEAGASCTDNKDTTCTTTTTGTVNTASVGTYTITYTATDASGNTSSKTRTVNVIAGIPPVVPDTTAPVITVLGTNPLSLTVGDAYTDAGATCTDNKDPTCTIVTTGTVNTSIAGSYTITYAATDAAGNASSKTRLVTVKPVPDTTAPVITVLGENSLNLTTGTAYLEAGATCVDNKDPTCTVVTTGTVNTAIAGSYTITYTATDAAGNVRTKTRAITVTAQSYKLPDTGITSSQCIGMGGYEYISCTSAAATALNPMQDGMRGLDVTEPAAADGKLGFSYSEVPNSAGGNFARTECVKDNLTGLMWEGKTDDGLRSISNYYTNYDNTAAIQLSETQEISGGGFTSVLRAPTQAEVDAGSNTIGYVAAVNAISLCGFSDWRLPTEKELQSLADYSGSAPAITVDWFPNTVTWDAYFASSVKGLNGTTGLNDFNAWYYRSNTGTMADGNRGGGYSVRLVRGTKSTNNFVISADEQEVTDTKTGLIWRRCAEGMTFVGGTCAGTAIDFSNESALVRANAQRVSTGVAWRLPNVKELNSIADNSRIAPVIDTTAFPATPLDYFNTSTFYVQSGIVFGAWTVNFHVGHVVAWRRYHQIKVRLVR